MLLSAPSAGERSRGLFRGNVLDRKTSHGVDTKPFEVLIVKENATGSRIPDRTQPDGAWCHEREFDRTESSLSAKQVSNHGSLLVEIRPSAKDFSNKIFQIAKPGESNHRFPLLPASPRTQQGIGQKSSLS
jgi:hypothetical protein